MFKYSNQSLKNRLSLSPELGYWLDYWLLLHTDDTHSVWCCRPLGLRSIAEAALSSNGAEKVTLRKQLIQEIEAVKQLVGIFSSASLINALPSDTYPASRNASWSVNWHKWFENVIKADVSLIRDELIRHLVAKIYQRDFFTTSYLTRRLAAELGQDEYPKKLLFDEVKKYVCDSGEFNARSFAPAKLIDTLRGIFMSRADDDYEVAFKLTPLGFGSSMLKKNFKGFGDLSLGYEVDTEGRYTLKEIKVRVSASHFSLAVTKGLNIARAFLEYLRLREYLRVSIYGAASVNIVNQPEVTYASLPQPFWTQGTGRRNAPQIPGRFDKRVQLLPQKERGNWMAARMHLSAAFLDWAEDVHIAAVKVWQALESFTKPLKPFQSIEGLTKTYVKALPIELAKHLALSISTQRWKIKAAGLPTDWQGRVPKEETIEDWMGYVLDGTSGYCYTTWKRPPAPELFFNPQVGLLQVVKQELDSPYTHPWMSTRTISDLYLLYALRNSVVHEGRKEFSSRMADYLGRVGAEVLLTVMGESLPQYPITPVTS